VRSNSFIQDESGAQEGRGFGGVEITCAIPFDVPKAMNRAVKTSWYTGFIVIK
jgi:hypothetical protein